jgi:hypothetical protein
MAVRGFEGFRKRFQPYQDQFLVIGGAACDLWFEDQGLRFRATKDIDMVLLLEFIDTDFVKEFWTYIQEAEYQSLERSGDSSTRLYRFEKPKRDDVPVMIELLSHSPDPIFPQQDQRIVPIRMEDAPSLSAIILNPSYYGFLLSHRTKLEGCPMADIHALLLFKARAWQDLTEREKRGEEVKSKDIKKHRSDVFRLAATLTARQTVIVPGEIRQDLQNFLDAFPPESEEWEAIQQGLRSSGIQSIPPNTLLETIRNTYLEGAD